MAVDATGAKNEPIFNSTGAPEIDVDPTAVAAYAAKVGNRRVGTTAERTAATGKDVWEGLEWYDTDDDTVYLRTSGGAWLRWHRHWAAYTPILTNFSGTPTVSARFAVSSGVVSASIDITLTGANVGTSPTISLPLTASSRLDLPPLGFTTYRDTSTTAGHRGIVVQVSTTVIGLIVQAVSGASILTGSFITATTPFTWASGDIITIDFSYEAA